MGLCALMSLPLTLCRVFYVSAAIACEWKVAQSLLRKIRPEYIAKGP